jgi:DNA-binding transcriptional MerR regulator
VGFTIGVLARSAGVSVETVRYYERRGLLEQPASEGFGYRQYTEEDLRRLEFVRRAKNLGFTLNEIRELLGPGSRSADEVLLAARAKLDQVDGDLRRLSTLRNRLSRLVDACQAGDQDCVALEVRGTP